ncbi:MULTISPECIES: glycosyltransferase family 10 [unclassified Mesorhizobium]|uniref:glycosyltransferase family 10 domain-containing protein n=1 Tax=unclassified Mesorhizobium TaxID=325217 RepID=UPI000FCC2A2E|nr:MULTISPECIES: glycosyltransferase family 10 [unclassified Mesorhizobium]TGP24021.1 alpha-1,3-fucosyltransferase [Mesorhizobium sp. M1D.F.Ca.ET.231.01.1.1]TGP35392.1 alpha-1,3-fucosyltransferase [Mesorhizobium sp. M1D.F.Ca.ET.234.01.1.1]TGS49414.1 alpha-1,3-fucosyltransferase [Mesorhizobium sp. M1D.F.Ca.ET.184.01.1.1]TGS63611.1 alpha-1,3-fucosyltransferase [Mesorhizobium sp. M1D.F.Ca.ET.183.01.1.1]
MPSKAPLILFYTRVFDKPADIAAAPACAVPAEWTNDRRRLSEADAVVFHLPNSREIGDARKYPGQLWVAWSIESVVNYPCMADAAFMRNFDITMTYESGSDVWTPYLPDAGWWEAASNAPILPKTGTTAAVHFQSSDINRSGRAALIEELSRSIGLDRYGKFNPNRHIEGTDLGRQTKLETIGRYPFCLALENSIAPDYVTEKMFDPLEAGTVPVYLGAPNAAEFVPDNSYIDAASFRTPAELAAYLRHLIETPPAYEAYLAWRSRPLPDRLAERLGEIETPLRCRLAQLVGQRLQHGTGRVTGRPSLPFGARAFLRTRLRRWRAARRGRPF